MPPPAVPASRAGPAVPLVPRGTVLSDDERDEAVAKAQEAMTYAAASEMTPMEHIHEAAELCGLRSELSVPEPPADEEMEESDTPSHVT
eukprot:5667791-Alexandrium_andersonii.AAC.1